MTINPWKSNKQQSSAIMNRLAGVVAALDNQPKHQNLGNGTMYFSVIVSVYPCILEQESIPAVVIRLQIER